MLILSSNKQNLMATTIAITKEDKQLIVSAYRKAIAKCED